MFSKSHSFSVMGIHQLIDIILDYYILVCITVSPDASSFYQYNYQPCKTIIYYIHLVCIQVHQYF